MALRVRLTSALLVALLAAVAVAWSAAHTPRSHALATDGTIIVEN